MSWRDQLRPATLGGASFLVEGADGSFGRNTQVHEYPLRDKPFVEDLGRRARRFTLEAYVLGPEYMRDRDALIAQIEKPGMTTLVHPYYGELKVSVVDCQGPRESTREGGMARFSITVIESGERVFPSADVDTSKKLGEQTHAAALASMEDFTDSFSTIGAPAFVGASATDLIKGFTDKLRSIVRTVTTVPGPIADFLTDLTAFSGALSNLIMVPQTLVSTINSLFEDIGAIVSQPEFALDIVRELFDFGADVLTPPTQTPSRQRQADNQAALINLIQQEAVIAAARITSQIEFGSSAQFRTVQDVLGLRDELIEQLDDKIESVGSDSLYYALADVRAAMVTDLQTRAAALASLISVTLPESAPTIVVAYDLYEDATRDVDIIARNLIRDPNFAPGGSALQVVADG